MKAGAESLVLDERSRAEVQQTGDLVTDFCACKCSTAEACMLPSQQRKFVGWNMDHEVLGAAEENVVLVLGFRVLDSN